MRLKPFLALCLALATAPAFAESPVGVLPTCAAYSSASDPFDPSGELVLRKAALAELEGRAALLSASELFGLGALYRLGREHPAAIVDQDLAKARRYIGEGASGGQIEAYASMAELELAAGDPMEAMMWAQVYIKAMRVRDKGRGLGYPANLLKRIGSRGAGKDLGARLAAFMQAQGDKFRARNAQSGQAPPEPTCLALNAGWPIALATDRAALAMPRSALGMKLQGARTGWALVHVLVDPDGSIASARVIETLPTARSARDLEPVLRALAFNAVDASAPQRTVLLPLTLDDGSARLRN